MDTNIAKHFAFVEAADTGNFTEAAKKLSYTQSAVSRMIADLEHEWDVVLLKRDRGGIQLTSDGQALLPASRELCEAYLKLQQQVDDLKGLLTGKLRIATFSSVATHLLPPIVSQFHEKHPRVEIEFMLGNYSEIEHWVKEGKVDCGFTRFPCGNVFDTQFFAQDEQMVILPKDHSLVDQKEISIEALKDLPFLALEQDGGTDVEIIFKEAGFDPNTVLTTWDDYAIMAFVEQGFGVSILPSLILKRINYDIAIRPLKKPVFREIHLIRRKNYAPSRTFEVFEKFVFGN